MKNPERLTVEEIIKEIAEQYTGNKYLYIVRLLRLFNRTIRDEYDKEMILTLDQLRFMRDKLLPIKYARKLTDSDKEAAELAELISHAKEMGLFEPRGIKVITNKKK